MGVPSPKSQMILSPLVISNTRFTPGLHGMNSAEIAALGDSVMRTFFVKEAVALQELESVTVSFTV